MHTQTELLSYYPANYMAVCVLLLIVIYFSYAAIRNKKTVIFPFLLTVFAFLAIMGQLFYLGVMADDQGQSSPYFLPTLCMGMAALLAILIQAVCWMRYRFFVKRHKHLKKSTFANNRQWLNE